MPASHNQDDRTVWLKAGIEIILVRIPDPLAERLTLGLFTVFDRVIQDKQVRAVSSDAAAKASRTDTPVGCGFPFSYGFSFGLEIDLRLAGADKIVSLDISEPAMTLAKTNIEINQLDLKKHEFMVADAFEKIREMAEGGKQFDFVILDPPAFVKDSTKIMQGARGYKDINRVALKLIPVGGYLMTCSCSHFIDRKLFQKIVHDAAIDAGRTLRILEIRGAGADHPININHPEGEYLKVLLCQVVE
jgi:23S rRNA (cytosine1962-C5)-methyltransferase